MLPNKALTLVATAITSMALPAAAWQTLVYDNLDCSLDGVATSYFTYTGAGQSPCITVGNNTAGGAECFYATGGAGGLACGDGTSDTIDTYALWLTGFAAEKEVSISIPDGTECTYCYTRGAFSCEIGDGPTCVTIAGICQPLSVQGFNNFNTIQMSCRDV